MFASTLPYRSSHTALLLASLALAQWPAIAAAGSPRDAAAAQLAPLPDSAPHPADNEATPAKVALGRQLFFDARLSGSNTMSCATCHLPQKALADGLPHAQGHAGVMLTRNTPTLLNVAWYDEYFWDGRAASLEAQALGPIQSPEEMHQDLAEMQRELSEVPGYVQQFRQVFDDAPTPERVAQALAAFERTLATGPSPLDRYLAGETSALGAEARRGLELFTGEADCVRCHRGPLLSDGKYYRLGIASADEGRAAHTGQSDDRLRFRTPSLRNVAQTAPYMHDGSFETLADVVTFYFREVPSHGPDGLPLDVQPLLDLSYSDVDALVAFLESLSGELPEIAPPELP